MHTCSERSGYLCVSLVLQSLASELDLRRPSAMLRNQHRSWTAQLRPRRQAAVPGAEDTDLVKERLLLVARPVAVLKEEAMLGVELLVPSIHELPVGGTEKDDEVLPQKSALLQHTQREPN